jgi:succinoglycan biosynthesis transport protein ExoP
MKPLPFDMTPLAEALEMPTTQPDRKDDTTPKASSLNELSTAPNGVFPGHISPKGGWLSSLAHEQIHALATHVMAQHTEQGLRTIAVTSALAGEGKTTVSLALAEKLAHADKRVLIIDLDTHRGTLSFEAELEGVAGALESSDRNGVPVPFHAYPTDCSGVWIMPTGQTYATGAGAVPLLDPERVQNLVNRGMEEFDMVLLDCPPLLPVADAHVITDVADRSMLVVRANSTPQEIVKQAIDTFGKDKLFAAVLNRAQPQFIPYFREVYGYYRRSPSRK